MSEARKLWLVVALAGAGWLFYLLAPVLTPFLISAVLAYLADPLVDRLEKLRLSRSVAVVVVFCILLLAIGAGVLILVPLLEQQISALVTKWPLYVEWVQQTLLPRVTRVFGIDPRSLNLEKLTQALTAHWQQAGGFAAAVFASVSKSGLAFLGWLANIVLIPVVTFYLLRDWDVMVAYLHTLLPRRIEPVATRLAVEADSVLGAFMRGQLSVMAALVIVYSGGLWIMGLDLALLIGLISGVVSFVPYLGFIVGIVLAGVASYVQFHEFMPLLWVALVFGLGQLLEGMVLTPWLVGDKIGLHPVAVIFAVMAGAQLFGFVGVLLALPAAAVLMVLVRYVCECYVTSALYAPPPE